jgi:CDGSH-type Zn-finger protein/truncated hemoglobin YjbI
MPEIDAGLGSLLTEVEELQATLEREASDDPSRVAAARLRDSVVRPLRQALELIGAGSDHVNADGVGSANGDEQRPGSLVLGDRVFELARAVTRLRVQRPDLPGLVEATAALQDVAIGLADESSNATRLSDLADLQAELDAQIQVARNGPYLVTNPTQVSDWLGQVLPLGPQVALCRCGGSEIKPLCDGTHALIGFTDTKDPNRVPDRLDTYVGQQVTIRDNRGTCQHSGFCTDRLATVFHLNDEPFVSPSGGRMDEIIRAVRDCPSGALSLAFDGMDAQDAQDEVDYHRSRPAGVEVSKNGPYRIIGGIPLVDDQGEDVSRNAGASREHYALCRCGHSQNKPFCSGMHWYVGFADPIADDDHETTIFEWAGGLPALTRMTRLFYEKYVPEDPLLAPLFATMSADHPERVAKWIGEVFCGPKSYSEEYGGYSRMLSQHLGKGLTEDQRTRWVALLLRSAHESGLPNDAEFRSAFGAYIEWGSRLAVENSRSEATPPEHMPMPRWDWHTAAGPPGSRSSALATPEQGQPEVLLPAVDEPVSFERHIKAMFRPTDKQSMSFAFDLWSYDDVAGHAEDILDRLRAGTMPCDGAWSTTKVDVFQRWVEQGKAH